MATERLTQLTSLVDAFNAHDLDRIMDAFADDCTLDMPRGPHPWGARHRGREAVRQALAGRFRGLPDVHYSSDEHWECGTHAVSRWVLTGTPLGGDPVEVHGCDLFDFNSDGQVLRKDSYWKIVEPSGS